MFFKNQLKESLNTIEMDQNLQVKIKQNQNRTSDLERGIKYFDRTTNEFGEVILLRNRITKTEFMLKEIKLRNHEAFNREIAKTIQRESINHPNILHFFDYSTISYQDSGYHKYIIRQFFNYYPDNLTRAIIDMKTNNEYFSLEEITILFYDIIRACAFLESKEHFHSEISPAVILINEENTFLLGDKLRTYEEFPQNQLDKYLTGKSLYISPEVFEAIQDRNSIALSAINGFKADVFSLGLSFLTTGLLNDVTDIYDKINNDVDSKKLKNYIQQFVYRYQSNPLICQVLKSMLEINPASRPSFIELQQSMPSFEQIKNYFNTQQRKPRPIKQSSKKPESFLTNQFGEENNQSVNFFNDMSQSDMEIIGQMQSYKQIQNHQSITVQTNNQIDFFAQSQRKLTHQPSSQKNSNFYKNNQNHQQQIDPYASHRFTQQFGQQQQSQYDPFGQSIQFQNQTQNQQHAFHRQTLSNPPRKHTVNQFPPQPQNFTRKQQSFTRNNNHQSQKQINNFQQQGNQPFQINQNNNFAKPNPNMFKKNRPQSIVRIDKSDNPLKRHLSRPINQEYQRQNHGSIIQQNHESRRLIPNHIQSHKFIEEVQNKNMSKQNSSKNIMNYHNNFQSIKQISGNSQIKTPPQFFTNKKNPPMRRQTQQQPVDKNYQIFQNNYLIIYIIKYQLNKFII